MSYQSDFKTNLNLLYIYINGLEIKLKGSEKYAEHFGFPERMMQYCEQFISNYTTIVSALNNIFEDTKDVDFSLSNKWIELSKKPKALSKELMSIVEDAEKDFLKVNAYLRSYCREENEEDALNIRTSFEKIKRIVKDICLDLERHVKTSLTGKLK